MLRTLTIASMVSALALFPVACAQEVNTSDKQAVEKIVKDYLLENPEVIIEALNVLDERMKQEAAEAAKVALSENSNALYQNANDYSIGPADAPVTVVEFFDYRCGFCKSAAGWVNAAPAKYDGKVRIVFKEMPILSPESRQAALAALAAGKQGKYTEMHRAMMADRSSFKKADIDRIAASVGVDIEQMRKDMESDAFTEIVDTNIDLARTITGESPSAPTFVVAGEIVRGADIDRLEQLIKDNS